MSEKPVNPDLPNSDRFGTLFEDYAPKLLRFLTLRLGNESDAQDLAQEAYFRLCRVEKPSLIREPDSYLFKIASNLAGEFLLKKNKRPPHVGIDNIDDGIGELDEEGFRTHLENRSEIVKLNRILSDLPPLYQAVLLLRKRDGYSHQEIAEQLNISPHTVHKYLKRALLKCRTLWTE